MLKTQSKYTRKNHADFTLSFAGNINHQTIGSYENKYHQQYYDFDERKTVHFVQLIVKTCNVISRLQYLRQKEEKSQINKN